MGIHSTSGFGVPVLGVPSVCRGNLLYGRDGPRYAGQGGVQCLFTGPALLLINTGVLICSVSDLDNLLCTSWLYYLIILPILLEQLLPHLLASVSERWD